MAPLTPVWTKKEVVENLKNKKIGIDVNTLFEEPLDSKKEDPECIVKELIQHQCNFHRVTGEFQCIPFTRLFKECKIYNNVKNAKSKTVIRVKEPGNREFTIQRIEITNMDMNDKNYIPSSTDRGDHTVVDDLKRYDELKRP